jgi:hypothetical protein
VHNALDCLLWHSTKVVNLVVGPHASRVVVEDGRHVGIARLELHQRRGSVVFNELPASVRCQPKRSLFHRAVATGDGLTASNSGAGRVTVGMVEPAYWRTPL